MLALFPFVASTFYLDLACQVFLASIGSLSLMLLTGYAGQISLGHAGLLCAGAFTAGILFKEFNAPIWLSRCPPPLGPARCSGVIFGLPSLRLRGLYLAVSTLALHFIVVYLGGEYETKRGFSTGIIDRCAEHLRLTIYGGRVWYFILLVVRGADAADLCVNLLRSRTGRAWRAIRAHETVAEALGIGVAAYKLLAFVISSAIAAVAGALFAYYRSFVSVEAFSLFLSIQYVAMIIIGGMGSLLGALLGAFFVTLFPYADRSRAAETAERAGLCRRAVRGELRGVRRRDDPVPGVRAARPRRHLAPHPDLFPALAVQASPGRGGAQMSEPLLAVDKLEVVYHRAITAVQGVILSVADGPDRRHSRHQRRRQIHHACARSRAFSASTMRASPKAASPSRASASRTGRRTR